MKNESKIFTKNLLRLSLFAMTLQTNMIIKINMLGDILSPAAIVQKIGLNKQAWMLAIAVMMLFPASSIAAAPVITSVTLNTTTPIIGSNVLVTVVAPGATSTGVSANGITLGLQIGTNTTYKGNLFALSGLHSVNVSATNTNGVTSWNNATKYTGTPVPPVITVLGSNPISVNLGSVYTAATDAGATAKDANGMDITTSIIETNNVNTGILGTSYFNYSVTDSAGTIARAARTVNTINIPPPLSGNGTVIIAFDDGWLDTFTVSKSVLEGNGQTGVVFAIPQVVDGSYQDYMSLSNLQTMYTNGWDISSHSMTHGEGYASLPSPVKEGQWAEFYLTRANNSQEKYELGDSKAWLDSNGFTKSSMFFAYPFGTYDNVYCLSLKLSTATCGTNDLTVDIKNAGYYIGARSIDAYSWRHLGKHPKYKNGDGDAEVLKMATLAIDPTQAGSTPAAVIDEINNTIRENGLLVLTFHHIVAGNPASSEEYSKANLTIISNYLAANSDKVKVQTFSQYFNVPNPIPTYTPGTPVAGVPVIGSNWIKAQWADGAGDKTDVFEVVVKKGSDTVGQTTYNVVNRYFNVSGLTAGMPVTVEVIAINRSWGWTNKNVTPLIINTGIPTYMPPTPTISAVVGSDYVLTTWVDGVGNKTDKFNVVFNGVWNNGTTNHSVNRTGMTPGQSSDVTVYALNGTTMNATPAILVSTIPIPATYMPPTPAISATIGGDYVLTTWVDGVGNKSDKFNVLFNGVWNNGTTNHSVNRTGMTPGQSSDVTVYALNGTTMNATPAILVSTIPIPATYMPPTPAISATIGGDYVLTTWVDGVGNKSDKFNVLFNGVWNNGTTNHSVNQAGMSQGQSSDVTVYALNGTTMNPTPAALVSTIPIPATYMPPTPAISATMGADWIMTNWTAGAGNMTDKFNVLLNGVWTNGTTNLLINVTNLSVGNYTDVKVYAVNGSMMNPTPASLNTTLTVPTPTPAPAPVHSGGGGGGSSGGSGGGSFYDPNAYKFERQDTTIHKDVLSTVQFKKNGLVDEVSFYGIKTYGDVTSVVSLLLNNPTTVPLDGVKTYFSVSLGTIKQAEEPLYINSGSITLTLDQYDIANKKVTFYRFVNGSWVLLESTEMASNKDTHSGHFKLSMPGFSNFAVVIQDVVSNNVAPAEVTAAVKLAGDSNLSTNPNVQKSPGFEVAGIVLVLSILYLRKKL
jgi:PGF-pre-PGF domain-containing protein